MFLLGLYLFIALFFSFMCSIAEAVLLSISSVFIAKSEQAGQPSGKILRQLKQDINKPLTAILTLNTVAHTVGAAGVGAQATLVFGDASLGVVSAILTLLILVFSEVIPKTLGASYWQALAPATAYCLKFMVWALYPMVKMAQMLTRGLVNHEQSNGFQRDEFAVMAQLSADEGHLDQQEAAILKNLMLLKSTKIIDATTPRTVMFSVCEELNVEAFFHKHHKVRFNRIPIYDQDPDNIVGYVLRSDLLLAHARGNKSVRLSHYCRSMPTLLDNMTLLHALKELIPTKNHIAMIVNEQGTLRGILTLEDIFETLLGDEIVDEGDKHVDMQQLANQKWKHRAKKQGIDVSQSPDKDNQSS